jgi:hypothetical protein
MAFYGQIIDDYDPSRDLIYKYFSDYFRNPTMTKIKDTGKHSMYITKLYCLLNRECRYIIVFVDKNSASPGTLEELRTMTWVSFQTRSLTDQYNDIEIHGYDPVADGPLMAKIHRTSVNTEASTYECETLPLVITLLHTEKNTPQTYQKSGTIINALETYQTIITFNTNSEFNKEPVNENQLNVTNINNQPRIPVQPNMFPRPPLPHLQNLQNFNQTQNNIVQPPHLQNQPRPYHTRNSKISHNNYK